MLVSAALGHTRTSSGFGGGRLPCAAMAILCAEGRGLIWETALPWADLAADRRRAPPVSPGWPKGPAWSSIQILRQRHTNKSCYKHLPVFCSGRVHVPTLPGRYLLIASCAKAEMSIYWGYIRILKCNNTLVRSQRSDIYCDILKRKGQRDTGNQKCFHTSDLLTCNLLM